MLDQPEAPRGIRVKGPASLLVDETSWTRKRFGAHSSRKRGGPRQSNPHFEQVNEKFREGGWKKST